MGLIQLEVVNDETKSGRNRHGGRDISRFGLEYVLGKSSSGKTGVGPIDFFDASEYPTRIAAEIKDFDPEDYMDKKEARTHGPVRAIRRSRQPRSAQRCEA